MASESKLGVRPFADEFDQFHAYQFSSLSFQISSNFDQSSSEVNLGKPEHILRNRKRFILSTGQITITSPIFLIVVTYWENRGHLGTLYFWIQDFLVGDIFFKCRSRTDGEKFHKTERGFYSRQVDIQKPPPYFTQVSRIGRFEEIFEPYFSVFMISCSRHVFAARVPASWR
jgi:hypothetical protein